MAFQKHKTKEEKALRRAKYTMLVASGFSKITAQRLRDWPLRNVIKVLYHRPAHFLWNGKNEKRR